MTMNGDLSFTEANMNLPSYYENVQGLDTAIRSITYAASASAKREVVAGEYGIIWQANRTAQPRRSG